jgi:hypothetical protein
MKMLAGIGISTEAVAALTQEKLDNLTDDPEERVPRLDSYVHTNPEEIAEGKPPKRESKFYTIPKDQWVQIEGSSAVAAKVNTQFDFPSFLQD